ncbi:MAG: hypothetical protein CMQ49_05275 [Gammaproteobacteria bacterium]|nr:hypothetical protein [Gammaproteobacteria bacterium]
MDSLSTPWAAVTAALLLSACTPDGERAAEDKPVAEYRTILGMRDLMHQVLEPAAEVIWDSAGYDITAAGEKNLAPTTDAGWERVADAAAVVMESANLLMLPGRSREGGWNEISAGLADAGLAARAAAESRNDEALFSAGARVYRVCVACHQIYWIRPQ